MKYANDGGRFGNVMIRKMENKETHLDFYRRWGKQSKPYFNWQLQQFSDYLGNKIGDIGCGLGNFVEFLKDKELYLGFEIDKDLIEEFKALNKACNVKLSANGDITMNETVEVMKANKLDTIICINVLEHIENDQLALANMVKGIADLGYICLIVPAVPWLYGSLDKLDGHYRRYSKKGLINLAKKENVDIVQCYYMNFIGAFFWFIKGRLLKEKAHKDENYKMMNILLPYVSRVEKIIKPPLGMSIVMVLRKRT